MPDDDRVRIPRNFAGFGAGQVLAVEHVTGSTFASASLEALNTESDHRFAPRLLAATLFHNMEAGFFHSDLHPGANIVATDGGLLPDSGSIGRTDSDTRSRVGEVLFAFSLRNADAFTDEPFSALPIVERLPHRIAPVTGGRAVVTFLAGFFGTVAAMLLTSDAGPQPTDTLTVFQGFGYLILVVAGVLTLRAPFGALRRRWPRSR